MPLKHPKAPTGLTDDLAIQTVFTLEGDTIPRHALREEELPRRTSPTRSSTTS